MPLTPFHLGPALFFGLLLFSLINLPTFIIASIILDLEPFFVLFFGLDQPLHGFFHSFLGASIIALVLFFAMIILDKKVQEITPFFRLEQRYTAVSILFASFLGVFLHILIDSFINADMNPFFPMIGNPLYANSILVSIGIYSLCILLFILGSILYFHKYIYNRH